LIADTIQRPSWSFVMEQSDARTADGNGPLPSNVVATTTVDARLSNDDLKESPQSLPGAREHHRRWPLGNARATGGAVG
jgi:hypothetical protein